jgi:hypothetical protein
MERRFVVARSVMGVGLPVLVLATLGKQASLRRLSLQQQAVFASLCNASGLLALLFLMVVMP